MRTVSFVEHLEFEYQGNISSKAVTVGDVDNDQGNELVLGNVHGELLIHKGSSIKPWKKCTGLGMITCVEIGNACNHGKNYLVVLSAEGWCHLFSIKPDSQSVDGTAAELPPSHPSASAGVNSNAGPATGMLKYVHRQHLAANTKTVIIADIDSDGSMELVVGFSDRAVKSYRWQEPAEGETVPGQLNGKFVLLENWLLAGQLGSITLNKRHDDAVDLMVSQPGGTFVTLLGTHNKANTAADVHSESTSMDGPSLVYHPLGTTRARNPGITTEVIGNISRRKKGEETYVPSYCAICTLDGTLTLVDEDKILWSLYVDHQLFTLTKLDVTGDGTEEVVACSWDGQTYIVNLSRDVVRFQFEDNVAAFTAGYYAVEGAENVPCLIYVTFNNRILVYYNIRMPEIGLRTLVDTMATKDGIQDLQSFFSVDGTQRSQLRQLYHWCLYGTQSKPS